MIFDIIVIVVLLISAVIALIRGFIRETLTIVGVVGGIGAAFYAGPLLTPTVSGWLGVKPDAEPEMLFGKIPYTMVAELLSYSVVFIGVVIVLSVVSHMLAESAKKIGLGFVDRTLGFIFGLVRGALLLALLYLPFYLLLDKETKTAWFETSRTHAYLEETSSVLAGFVPAETIERLEKDAGKIQNAVDAHEQIKGEPTQEEQVKGVVQGAPAPDSASTVDVPQPAQSLVEPEVQVPAAAEQAPSADAQGYAGDLRDKMDKMLQETLSKQNPESEQAGENVP